MARVQGRGRSRRVLAPRLRAVLCGCSSPARRRLRLCAMELQRLLLDQQNELIQDHLAGMVSAPLSQPSCSAIAQRWFSPASTAQPCGRLIRT